MSRISNKKLVFLLAGLIIVLIVTVVVKIPKENATLKTKIVDIDTLSIDKIKVYAKADSYNPVEFKKVNGEWMVSQGDIISKTRRGAVQNIFGEVLNMKPTSLAAMNKSKWEEYGLTDSLATRVQLFGKKGKEVADIMIGKFTYKRANNAQSMYSRNNIQGTSYVRLHDEKEVYAVDGFISFFFNVKFNDWRDKSFVRLNKDDVTNLSFVYPNDSSYNLVKNDLSWYCSDKKADSLTVKNYIQALSLLDGQEIVDNYKPAMNPVCQLKIEGNNMLKLSVDCYSGDNNEEYILHSSRNPDVFYKSKKNGIFDKVFKPQNYFINKK